MSNSTRLANTAVGTLALNQNTTGSGNSAFGASALSQHTTGDSNNAGTGSFNVYLGVGLGSVAGEVGHTHISNIKSTILNGGGTDTVTVDLNTGLLGHLTFSRRYKEDIEPMGDASYELHRLKPVSYRYKKEFDRTQSPAFGLIAEEVAAVNPALVASNAKGLPESVHYEMVNAMLLNDFLKEHQNVKKLEAAVADLAATVKQQAEQLQKVTAQTEVNHPAAQLTLNNK